MQCKLEYETRMNRIWKNNAYEWIIKKAIKFQNLAFE